MKESKVERLEEIQRGASACILARLSAALPADSAWARLCAHVHGLGVYRGGGGIGWLEAPVA